jgi:hypothetical protein
MGCAAAVLVFGFGALNLFYWLTPQDAQLPGLYSYWGSTVGDGVILPVATYFLSRAVLVAGRRLGALARVPAVCGVLTGAAVSVLLLSTWIGDAHPELNWTLPTAGVFSAAGWYHAAFLLAVAASFAGAFAVTMRYLFTSGRYDFAAKRHLLWFLICTVTFGALVAFDNLRSPVNTANVATLLTLAIATAIVVVIATRLRRSRAGVKAPIG